MRLNLQVAFGVTLTLLIVMVVARFVVAQWRTSTAAEALNTTTTTTTTTATAFRLVSIDGKCDSLVDCIG
jgi:hypothetical protein